MKFSFCGSSKNCRVLFLHSFIAEGTANYGIDVAFPGNEQVEFEKEVLYQIAGINIEYADLYYEIMQLIEDLTYAGNEAARNYLDEKWSRGEAVEYLKKYTLSTKDKAEKKIDFYEKYRSYVINYNYGEYLFF